MENESKPEKKEIKTDFSAIRDGMPTAKIRAKYGKPSAKNEMSGAYSKWIYDRKKYKAKIWIKKGKAMATNCVVKEKFKDTFDMNDDCSPKTDG